MTDEPLTTDTPPLELIPLGGLGEFGMNMMVVACGDTAILIDAGVMFPEPELLGVDLIIPDLRAAAAVQARRARADARPRRSHRRGAARAAATSTARSTARALTLAFVESKLEEHGASREGATRGASARASACTVGPFTIEFLRVTHSMPDCVAVAIETPRGVVIHTGDFKIDQTPLDGEHVDFHRLRRARVGGRAGAAGRQHQHRPARASPDRRSRSSTAFEEIFTSAKGKIVVAMFASSIYRMQILVDLAAQFDRRVAFVGRGVIDNSEIAQRLGYLRIPAGVQIRDSDVRNFPAQDVVCICTGSQGEPQAALPRIAIDDHRHVKLGAGRRRGVFGPRDSRATRRRSAG